MFQSFQRYRFILLTLLVITLFWVDWRSSPALAQDSSYDILLEGELRTIESKESFTYRLERSSDTRRMTVVELGCVYDFAPDESRDTRWVGARAKGDEGSGCPSDIMMYMKPSSNGVRISPSGSWGRISATGFLGAPGDADYKQMARKICPGMRVDSCRIWTQPYAHEAEAASCPLEDGGDPVTLTREGMLLYQPEKAQIDYSAFEPVCVTRTDGYKGWTLRVANEDFGDAFEGASGNPFKTGDHITAMVWTDSGTRVTNPIEILKLLSHKKWVREREVEVECMTPSLERCQSVFLNPAEKYVREKLTDVDFVFLVEMSERFSRTKKYPLKVWSQDGDVFLERKDWGCQARARIVEESGRHIVLSADFERGVCGKGLLTISHFERHLWKISWKRAPAAPSLASAEFIYKYDPEALRVANPTETVSDDGLGITLAEGPLRRRIGPTSQVVAVESGGVAALSGIEPGQLILAVGIVGPPASQLHEINEEFERDRVVKVLIEKPDGTRHFRYMMPPPQDMKELAVVSAGAINRIYSADRREFHRDQPALQQLIALSKALGIEQTDISQAIADGRLNPRMSDLIRAFVELDTTTCADLARRVRESEEPGTSLYKRATDCEWITLNVDERRISAWNARFGARPKELETRGAWRIDQTVIAYFKANDVVARQYSQRRCDFTVALSKVANVIVECDGVTPTRDRNLAFAQAAAARRDDIFGDADDPMSYRMRLMADGGFEALEKLAAVDDRSLSPPSTDLVYPIEDHLSGELKPRYTPLIASYIVRRVRIHGACGDRLVRLVKSVTDRRRLATLSGITIREDDYSYDLDIEVPSAFAPTVETLAYLRMPGEGGSSRIGKRLGAVLSGASCESDERLLLEANMRAYIAGEPPQHRR